MAFEFWLPVFAFLGYAATVFIVVSPLITFNRIVDEESTLEYSGLPYVATLVEYLLKGWYESPTISKKKNLLVHTTNGAGVAIELAYVLIFLYYAPKTEKRKIGLWLLGAIVLVLVVVFLSILAFDESTSGKRRTICGIIATCSSVLTYAAPLSSTETVLESKSAEFMPLSLSVAVFVSAFSWLMHGLLDETKDKYQCIPHGIGVLCGAAQLYLIAKYYKNGNGKRDTQP